MAVNLFRITNYFLLSILPVTCVWSVTPIDLKHNSAPLSQLLSSTPGLGTLSSFKTISTYTDFRETEHKRFKQTYHGYPVWGAEVVVHTRKPNHTSLKGALVHSHGLIYQGINEELDPPPLKDVAKEQTDRALNEIKRLLSERTASPSKIIKTKTGRIIFVDSQNKAHWAYHIELIAVQNGSLSQTSYIIDAINNELYSTWNNLHTLNNKNLAFVKGGGYGGNGKIGYIAYEDITPYASSFNITRDAKSGQCILQGSAKSFFQEMIFFSVNNGSNFMKNFLTEPVTYACLKKNPLHAGLYWNDDINFAADNNAFYNANITSNMYLNWFKTPVVLNPGPVDENEDYDLLPIQVYTHLGMDNAFWIGALKSIFLGDGNEESDTFPYTSLDIVAHELSHGFTEQHANLVYKNQSGGLNESFSDMAAVAASYYLTGESNWTIGSDIGNTPLRYIDNPRRDCVGKSPYIDIGGYKIRQCSIDHTKDFQEGSEEGIPFVDVHLSSGIFNKAFYLMAQGWGGDKQRGTQKAFNVMVQANRGYWTPNTSFQDAACGVMEATRDYAYDENVVIKAMSSVGIDAAKC